MTYGKWKALQPRVEVVIHQEEEKKPEIKGGMSIRECKYCGKAFSTANGQMYYCDYDCYYEAARIRNKERYRMKKERMMADGKV